MDITIALCGQLYLDFVNAVILELVRTLMDFSLKVLSLQKY